MTAWKNDRLSSGNEFSNFAMMNSFAFGKLTNDCQSYKIQYLRAMKRAACIFILYAAALFIFSRKI